MPPKSKQATLPHGEHPIEEVCPDCPRIHGQTRPPQPHYAKYHDEAIKVGRIEVTNLLGEEIEKIGMSLRSYPDLYAHKLTEAMIRAGLVEADLLPLEVTQEEISARAKAMKTPR